jgi:hypothetical protein
MNIYKMKKKDLSKLLIEFSKCEYGKIQFIISYSLFIVLFLILIAFIVFYILTSFRFLILFIVLDSLLSFIVFLVGSAHFYNEVRFFSYGKEKSSR